MMRTCCVTGHRDIPADKVDYVKAELLREVFSAIDDGYTVFLSGFAEGVDLFFASIVAELKLNSPLLKLGASIPHEKRLWTKDTEFRRLLGLSDIVHMHSPSYAKNCYMKRNREMVDSSQRVIAVYDGREKGGTYFTVRYASERGKEMRIIRLIT